MNAWLSAVGSSWPAAFVYQDRDFSSGVIPDLCALQTIDRFIAVVGSSSGKSSLVRAGLLPLLDVETREAGGRNCVA
jgi:hypothetical protein